MTTYRVPVLRDFAWQPPVADRVTVPAGGESKGDRYLIIAAGSGVFTGKENQIATANQNTPTEASHWIFDTPVEGWTTWVKDEDAWYVFDGAVWNKESIDVIQSQILVLESEMSQTQSRALLLESEMSQTQSRALLLESEVSTNLVSIASLGAALLVLESEVSANVVAITVVASSEASQASLQSAIASRVLVLESEMSQAGSELLTKQSEATYTAEYGCLEFII